MRDFHRAQTDSKIIAPLSVMAVILAQQPSMRGEMLGERAERG
jgi:hypothetical protein